MANFVQKEAKIRAVRDMNVRRGTPSLTAPAVSVPKGTIFAVVGYVSDGDEVSSNSCWYKTGDDNYLWSGNVEIITEGLEKLLHSPLKHLICTQRFGERPDVYKKYGSPKGHNGLDFRTWVNNNPSKHEQPVFAVLDGEVSESGDDPKFKGNYVRVKHDNSFESAYLHLSKRSVKQGQRVSAGEEIGISGNTGGASEAPHLHFGYRPIKRDENNGYMGYVDPTNLFIDEIKYV